MLTCLIGRAAQRFLAHFQDLHYRPLASAHDDERGTVGDRPLSWWAVRRVTQYSGRVNLWLASGFVLLYAGPSGLETDPGRDQWGRAIEFKNTTPYKTYRILITGTRAEADATQYSEVRLGTAMEGAAQPASN